MPLSLSTEPYPRSGGLSGEGARRLLGVPALTPLQTVIREAGQNSWDARRGENIRFDVNLRRPDESQWRYLREEILAELPSSDASRKRISDSLNAETPMLLEIADFGTKGLGGPTRADIIEDGKPQNFANFVRNIGAGHHHHLGGGTYGYGKTSFYKLDAAAIVIIDTLALTDSGTERRLIACHLGDEFTVNGKRYTGRHWWGQSSGDPEYVEPLLDTAAEQAARSLGLPPRSHAEDTGTTVSVLVPGFGSQAERIREITEALLWFFWPKMIERDDGRAPISFTVRYDGEEKVVPRPETFPPLDLFVDAWHQLERGQEGVREIWCGNPKKLLGKMSVARGFRGDRRALSAEPVIPVTSRHVVLMRPVELVVRYLEGPALPHGSHEWAGVFICDTDEEVERAFAESEPPAHDDWSPDNLPKGRAQTFVRTGLRRIKEAMTHFIYPSGATGAGMADQPPLARAATMLGTLIPPESRERSNRASRAQTGRRRRWSVSEAAFIKLEALESGVDALFEVNAQNRSDEPLIISAAPGAVLDDDISDETELPNGGKVEVVSWETADGVVLSSGGIQVLDPHQNLVARVRVRIPELAAVGLLLEVND